MYLDFCIFGDIWVLRDPTFPATKEKKHIRNGLSRGTWNTCAKFQGVSLKNGVDMYLDFCAINCKNHGCFASELVGFSVDSILGFKYDGLIVPTQSVLRIIALNFVKTCLGAPGSGSFRKNVSFFLLAVNTRLLLTSLRAVSYTHLTLPTIYSV